MKKKIFNYVGVSIKQQLQQSRLCSKITIFSILINMLICFTICTIIYADQAASGTEKTSLELFTGNTMGTTYYIKVVMQKIDNKDPLSPSLNKNSLSKRTLSNLSKNSLHYLIEEKLKQVNQSMSVYSKDSEISLFNKSDKEDVTTISPDFYSVMLSANKLYTITEGAWDGTVKPLVDLWGFGTKKEILNIPSSEIIRAHLQTTGFKHIVIGHQTLQKQNSAITLDLGSIAKGFGVDAVAQLLKNQGYFNFLVEIGGEVFASGEKVYSEQHSEKKRDNSAEKKAVAEEKTESKSWMVGISRPDKGQNSNEIYHAFPLRNKALATSGDYRNFITINGKSYSHIINPATGYPVNNGVVSASVISDTCTFADGLATALMIMGQEKGIRLVNSLENTECLIVVRDKNGNLADYRSEKFPLP
ncbi:MAG: FAD:protein FMN transferase [Desulfamplus sp.]|nr:FAD:protein FMN transferase [Desulfamplus sp.]